jgi:hypothetical protein
MNIQPNVANRHQFDADPDLNYHFNADPDAATDPDFYLIRIRILTFVIMKAGSTEKIIRFRKTNMLPVLVQLNLNPN